MVSKWKRLIIFYRETKTDEKGEGFSVQIMVYRFNWIQREVGKN